MKKKTLYRCSNCGFESIKWLGKCPDCNSWNTLEDEVVDVAKTKSAKVRDFSSSPIYSILLFLWIFLEF